MRSIMRRRMLNLPFEQAVGRTAACSVGTYPPGVPLVVPGQTIEWDDIEHLAALKSQGYTLFGCDGNTLDVADI